MVSFLPVLGLHGFGKAVDDFFVFFEFELGLDEVGLFNEVVDFSLEFFRDFVVFAHAVEVFEFFLLFLVFGLYFPDNRPHTADVVGQSNAADGFNENESDCLNSVGGADISESHSEHDVGSPVIPPNVLSFPVFVLNIDFRVPILSLCA